VLSLFAIGIAAGFALALPVGPMALLLVTTSLERGWRHGALGALAMALVDGCYAATIYFVGATVSGFLNEWHLWLSVAGAGILLFLAAQLFARNMHLLKKASDEGMAVVGSQSLGRTFLKFVSATIINPPTALYFLAIAPSVSVLAVKQTSLEPVVAGITFALSVFLGSLGWQESLAIFGSAARKITGTRARATIGLIGSAALLLMSLGVAASALVT